MRFMNPKVHGYIDYLYVIALALAPTIFNFSGMPAVLCYVLAGAVLVLSLLTNYPLGAVKAISFPAHGGIELVSSIVVIAAPWLFGFADVEVARNFFLVAGALLLGVWAITDYRGEKTFSPESRTEKEKTGVR